MYSVRMIESHATWTEFLNTVQPNTFLHSWPWGEFQKATGERIWRLGIYAGETLRGIVLIIKVQAKRGSFLFCPHGPVLNSEFRMQNAELALRALVDYLKPLAREEKCSFARFSPLMLSTPENNRMWHTLGFREAPIHMHPELAWILDITPSEDEILKGMRKTTRYSIRKAEKDGVEVITSTDPDDIEKFWSLYSATVDRQHFVPFSKDYLRKEFEIFAAQNCATLILGTYRHEVIAAAFVVFTPWSGFYHHGASISKYINIPASQLVQWHALLEAKRRGCKKYNFWGVVPESAKNHPWAGLTRFKKGFGGYAEQYVHAKDLPLVATYWLTYAIERIRRWRRRL